MIIRHTTVLPTSYEIERHGDGMADVWLCKQIDTYITVDGIREHDIDVRVLPGIEDFPEIEFDIRTRWEDWWDAATRPCE